MWRKSPFIAVRSMSSSSSCAAPGSPYEESPGISISNGFRPLTTSNLESKAYDCKADLANTILTVERIDRNLYRAHHLLRGLESRPWIYGGQVIGQALAAASLTVEPAYSIHSLHSYFLTAGSVEKPILYMIDPVRDGRSFCTRVVKAVQDGEAIFSAMMSFHRPEPDAFVHQRQMPKTDMDPEHLM